MPETNPVKNPGPGEISPDAVRSLRWLTGSVLAISIISAGAGLWRESQVASPLLLDAFDQQFVAQETPASLLCALVAVIAFFVSLRADLAQQAGDLAMKWDRRWVVAAVVTLVCAIGSLNVYRMAAISGDEYANVTQTQIFAHGSLTGQWPPWMAPRMAPPELANRILVADDGSGRVVTSYQPVFSIVSAPFERLGIRFIVNPLIAGTVVVLAGACAWQLFGAAWIAGLAMMMMAGSVSVAGFGMAGFATNFVLMLHLFFALFFIRGLQQDSRINLLIAGTAGAMAMHTANQMSHLLLAIPAFIVLLRTRKLRVAAWMAMPYVPFVLIFTFGWTSFVQGVSHSHRREVVGGLGSALTELSWLGQHLRVPTFRQFQQDFMSVLRFFQWAVPGLGGLFALWVFTPGKFVAAQSRPDEAKVIFFKTSLGAVVAATAFYFFFPLNQGHGWGYRYLQPFLGFFLLPGLAIVHLYGQGSRIVTWLLLSSFLSVATILPLRISQISSFVAERLALLPCLPADVPQICFVDTKRIYWGPDLIQNEPFVGHGPWPDQTFGEPLKSRIVLRSIDGVSDEEFVRARFPGFNRAPGQELPGTGSIWVPPAAN